MAKLFESPIAAYQTKADIVHERLRSAIMDGSARSGDKLNIDKLVRELGVSKIPVREALHKLEAEGLVIQTPHIGARVASLSAKELKGAFLIRASLEGLATRLAAQTISEAQLDKLRSLQVEMQEQHSAGELRWMTQQNRQFHVLIAQASGYKTLEDLIEKTLSSIIRYRQMIKLELNVWAATLNQHQTIIGALEERDEDRSEQAAKDHVTYQLRVHIQKHLDQMPADDEATERSYL